MGSTNMQLEAFHWLSSHLPYWWGGSGYCSCFSSLFQGACCHRVPSSPANATPCVLLRLLPLPAGTDAVGGTTSGW